MYFGGLMGAVGRSRYVRQPSLLMAAMLALSSARATESMGPVPGLANALITDNQQPVTTCTPASEAISICKPYVTWSTTPEDAIVGLTLGKYKREHKDLVAKYDADCDIAWTRYMCTWMYPVCTTLNNGSINVESTVCPSLMNDTYNRCYRTFTSFHDKHLEEFLQLTIPLNTSVSNCHGDIANPLKTISQTFTCFDPLKTKLPNHTDETSLTSCLAESGCCLSCPPAYYFYPNGYAAIFVAVTGAFKLISLLLVLATAITYIVLPTKRSHPRKVVLFISISMALWILPASIGFMSPSKVFCKDEITLASQSNNWLCGITGAFFIFGMLSTATWSTFMLVNIHVQAVWQSSILGHYYLVHHVICWGVPLLLTISTVFTGSIRYDFGPVCFASEETATFIIFIPIFLIVLPGMLLHIYTTIWLTSRVREQRANPDIHRQSMPSTRNFSSVQLARVESGVSISALAPPTPPQHPVLGNPVSSSPTPPNFLMIRNISDTNVAASPFGPTVPQEQVNTPIGTPYSQSHLTTTTMSTGSSGGPRRAAGRRVSRGDVTAAVGNIAVPATPPLAPTYPPPQPGPTTPTRAKRSPSTLAHERSTTPILPPPTPAQTPAPPRPRPLIIGARTVQWRTWGLFLSYVLCPVLVLFFFEYNIKGVSSLVDYKNPFDSDVMHDYLLCMAKDGQDACAIDFIRGGRIPHLWVTVVIDFIISISGIYPFFAFTFRSEVGKEWKDVLQRKGVWKKDERMGSAGERWKNRFGWFRSLKRMAGNATRKKKDPPKADSETEAEMVVGPALTPNPADTTLPPVPRSSISPAQQQEMRAYLEEMRWGRNMSDRK
ncbi:hypothetical protein BJ742DRAFT_834609 [Cladochytrium replicatum]|nr:hypothetical protein BJ742DRAFT_834609 [Cladochytrium replicatum]